MRRLDLNFQPNHKPGLIGWGLLAFSLLTLGGLVWSHDQLRREMDSVRVAGKNPRAAAARSQGGRPEPAAAEVASARQALDEIGLPWDDVFGALEGAAHKDVALLAVNPDPRRGSLRIMAEARNLAAMLAYHQRLQAAPHLRDVALTDHEVARDDPQRPVRFNIMATWVVPQ